MLRLCCTFHTSDSSGWIVEHHELNFGQCCRSAGAVEVKFRQKRIYLQVYSAAFVSYL